MYLKLVEKIKKLDGKVYIVGGAIRGLYNLGVPIKEADNIDIEVMGINSDQLEEILEGLGRWKLVGSKYKVYLIKNLEIKLSEYNSIKESILERDLTVNSLYYDLITKETIDLNGGLGDIKNKILRYNDRDRFLQDPLRILRTIELSSRLGFEIEGELKTLIKSNFSSLREVSKERVMMELEKILMNHEKPSKGFEILDSLGGTEVLFPELEESKNIIQDKIYHPEGDVYTHTLMTLDILKKEERSLDIMIALLFHDIGKNRTIENRFKGHTRKSQEMFKEVIKKFTNNKKLIKSASNLILYHGTPLVLMLNDKINKRVIRKLMLNTDIPKLLKVYKADLLGRGKLDNNWELSNIEKIEKIYNEEKGNTKRLITGAHLIEWGYTRYSDYSRILKVLHFKQLEDKIESVEDGERYFKEYLNR